jgi:hypothetical protein
VQVNVPTPSNNEHGPPTTLIKQQHLFSTTDHIIRPIIGNSAVQDSLPPPQVKSPGNVSSSILGFTVAGCTKSKLAHSQRPCSSIECTRYLPDARIDSITNKWTHWFFH